jgi:SpoVK/Ycf46/Vps4 family AAA+-type ATPase
VQVHIGEYVGSFLYLGRAVEKLAETAQKLPPAVEGEVAADRPKWPDPSVPQLRQAVTEYCIWPLGEQELKDHWSGVRSALLVGCKGSGKRMLANAIATESGANFFDLSPSNTNGKYPGKKGPYEMLYATLKLAKAYQPSVVWIGDVEVRLPHETRLCPRLPEQNDSIVLCAPRLRAHPTFRRPDALPPSPPGASACALQSVFQSGKAKKGAKAAGDPANRILKPLKELVEHKSEKKRLLSPTDRVLILGASDKPYACEKSKDYNALVGFFKKILFLPLPDYPSRYMLWQEALKRQGLLRPPADDVQTLARISENYSSGSIMRVVRRSISQRRIERIDRKPFSMNELVGPLAKEIPVYGADDKAMYDWYVKTLGLDKKNEAEGAAGKKDKKAVPKKK